MEKHFFSVIFSLHFKYITRIFFFQLQAPRLGMEFSSSFFLHGTQKRKNWNISSYFYSQIHELWECWLYRIRAKYNITYRHYAPLVYTSRFRLFRQSVVVFFFPAAANRKLQYEKPTFYMEKKFWGGEKIGCALSISFHWLCT